jgi:hypothetical protein
VANLNRRSKVQTFSLVFVGPHGEYYRESTSAVINPQLWHVRISDYPAIPYIFSPEKRREAEKKRKGVS